MNFLAKIFLSLILALTSVAQAAPGLRNPEQMLTLVDEYIAEVSSKQPGPVYLLTGREAYLAKAVATQIAALEPEDFNLFQFYLMDRYIKEPAQREHLYAFNRIVRDMIATDLANSASLRSGPWHEVVVGSYTYGAWILLGSVIGWRFLFSRSTRAVDFARGLKQRELSMAQSPALYRLGYKAATNPLILSVGAGAGAGYLNYLLQSQRTHRVDPLQIMMVVQAQLACHLSYSGLAIQEKFESIRNAEEFPAEEGKKLLAEIASIGEQSKVLSQQFGRLEQIDVRDPLFQRTLQQFPKSESWAQFRSSLTDAETSRDGKCRQMSLVHLKLELDKTAMVIGNLMPVPEETSPGTSDQIPVTPIPLPEAP